MPPDQIPLAWLIANAYALACAAVHAFDRAPMGSGVDGALDYATEALEAMFNGERDPLKAAPPECHGDHWLARWQKSDENRVEATEMPNAR